MSPNQRSSPGRTIATENMRGDGRGELAVVRLYAPVYSAQQLTETLQTMAQDPEVEYAEPGGGAHSVTKEGFTWVSTAIGNVKKAISGTYHAINPKHLPRYLAEFCCRHNRRFQLENMLPRFAYVAVRTPPMPMRLLKMAEAYG